MAQSLASSGTSARIFYLPTATAAPVVQQPGRPGRYPKAITSLYRHKRDKHIAKYMAQQRASTQGEVVEQRAYVAEVAKILAAGQYELARLQQQAQGASHV